MLPSREIEMVWECPRCGTQLAQMQGVKLEPPLCSMGHDDEEMEQKTATRWAVPADDE